MFDSSKSFPKDHRDRIEWISKRRLVETKLRLSQTKLIDAVLKTSSELFHHKTPATDAYLTESTLCLQAEKIVVPKLWVGDTESRAVYPYEEIMFLAAGVNFSGIRALSFECWGVPERYFPNLHDKLTKPQKTPLSQHKVVLDMKTELSCGTSIIQSSPDLYWLCPAVITGIAADGQAFTFNPALRFAKNLKQITALGIAADRPREHILLLRPENPMI